MLKKDGIPLRMALGFALGSCVNFFPTMGFGFPLALAIAFVSRTNAVVAVAGEMLFKPLFPLFFHLNFTLALFCRVLIQFRRWP